MTQKTKSAIFTAMRIVITAALIFAFTFGIFVLFEKYGLNKYNEWTEAKKELRAWFLLTAIYYAPIFTACLAFGIVYGKKRTVKSHYEKLAGFLIGAVVALIATVITIKKITAGAEDADTTVMKYYVIWIVRQILAFTVIAAYQATRAKDNDVTEPLSLDDSDPSPDEVDVQFVEDD